MSSAQRLVVGRYRLIRPLAEGGFGRVWEAHDEVLRADVVVKEVRLPPAADSDEQAKRLIYAEREARNAARLRHHPGIVPVYDVAVEDGRPWIVMQLVDGGSLEERLNDGPLPVGEVSELAGALLEALDAAHRAGVVHRDVKPANVMLAADGRIMLTDFGIAAHPADTRLTMDGAVIGSLEYIAPERLNGDAGAPASDLFSLGVTLYRAVEGVSPFLRDSYAATLAAVVREAPPPPRRAGRLAPLIRALLAKDPDARPTVPEALALLHPDRKRKKREGPPRVEPGTETVSRVDASFEESWTGDEDPREFSEYEENLGVVFFLGGFGILLLVLALTHDWKGNAAGEILMYVLAGVFLLGAAALEDGWAVRRTLRKGMRARTLEIGRDGVTTTDASGAQRFPWTAIAEVAVRRTDTTVHEHSPLALHLRMRELDPGVPTVLHRPAGWPIDADLPDVCRGPHHPGPADWVPVCVLGPLPATRRLDLKNAVAAYTKHPLTAEKDW